MMAIKSNFSYEKKERIALIKKKKLYSSLPLVCDFHLENEEREKCIHNRHVCLNGIIKMIRLIQFYLLTKCADEKKEEETSQSIEMFAIFPPFRMLTC